jgi:hypothetical protein
MEIEIFTLCDFAQNNNGKLTIVGTFDRLFTTQLPVIQNCCVVVKMRLANSEEGKHSVKLKFIDADGKEFIQSPTFDIDHRANPEEEYNAIPLIMNLHPLQIDKAGKYAIELYYDGEFKSGLRFMLVKAAPQNFPKLG